MHMKIIPTLPAVRLQFGYMVHLERVIFTLWARLE